MRAKPPSPIEGAALYAVAAYMAARDVFCQGEVHHLLSVCIVGAALAGYCLFRVVWCVVAARDEALRHGA